MACSEKDLQQQLMEAGTKLLTPPSSVDELLPLLDQIENCLAKVEQSPSKSMLNALAPSLKALVTDKIFKHSDVDVKVAVACCISEITRITAPEAPYDDDLMKDVFQLIVSSFENLCDKSSRSYNKRTSILETVAKVRSCVVMLDLECDELIIEMFQHFLSSVRDYHPDNVFSSMETIMSLVLEESEDISIELLSPLLATVKKGNEEVLPIARKLGEKVLETCANKVKPYLQHAVKSLGISLDDYSDVVASIYQESSGSVEQNVALTGEENKVKEGEPLEASPDEATQDGKDRVAEAASPKLAELANDKSPKSVVSNGVVQTCEDESLDNSSSLKKQDDSTHADPSNNIASTDADVNNLDSKKSVDDESKPEVASKKRGRKVRLSIKLAEPSESSNIDAEKSVQMQLDEKSNRDSEPPADDVSGNAKEGKGGSEAKLNKRSKKGISTKDSEPSADDVVRKNSDGISDSEEKVNKKSSKKTPGKISNEEKTSKTDASKKKTASESETKSVKKPSKKVDLSNSDGDEASLTPLENKKQRSRGKSASEKNSSKGSSKDDDKVSSPKSAGKSTKSTHQLQTPKTDNKRKHASGNEKGSETQDNHADDLVGRRVKVYWPQDKQYYKGTVYSYVARTKKHEVVYDDGDKEILNMNRQKWEFIEDEDDVVDEVEAVEPKSPDAPTETPPKKKARTSGDQSAAKHGKADPAKGEKASSSKSKSASGKSAKKSKDSNKTDDKSTDDSKALKTTDDENLSKIKSGSKSAEVSKSKNADTSASKSSKKTPTTPSNSKNKSSKSTGKSKSSSKVKEIVDDIGDSTDSDEPLETVKVKSKAQNSSKGPGSEAKSEKKRRRA